MEQITVTLELINSLTSSRGGYTNDFFDLFEISEDDRRIVGWKQRAVGRKIDRAKYEDFVARQLHEPKNRRGDDTRQGDLFNSL